VFEAFAERDYRRFWTAQFVSNIGTWMQTVAQGYLVYQLSDSAFLLGFVGFANAIPSLFLMLYGGVLADRFDRRKIVNISQAVQALSALGIALAIFTKQIEVWHIVTASVVSGIAISFSAPAWQAMVLDLLDDRSRLSNAVAMNSLQFQLSRAIGPLLAGATLSAFGSFWCFFFNALSFVPLIFVLGRIRKRQQHHDEQAPVLDHLTAGFQYVRGDKMILVALGVAGAASIFGFPYLNLMPIVARRLFPADEARGLGYLMGSVGVGAMLAALSLSIRTPPRKTMLPTIVVTLGLFGTALTCAGLVPWPSVEMVLLLLCGVSMVSCLALCNTSIQQRVPDHMRGRVLSMYTFSFYALYPFGSLASGAMAERRGIRLTLAALGILLIVSAVLAGTAIRRRKKGRTLYGDVQIPDIEV
jgi:MFS family permease